MYEYDDTGRFACLCCGHRTLERPPGRSNQLCEVCLFEDRWHPIQGTRDEIRLAEFQVAFASHGVVDPTMKELARSARPDEASPDWFFPLADAAATLIPLLHLAFQSQRLKKGSTSLELAELTDNYGMEDEYTQ